MRIARYVFAAVSLVILASCVTTADGMRPLERRLAFRHLTPQVFHVRLNRFLAIHDFDGDGRDDLLMGGAHSGTTEKTPIKVLISQGDGTFRDATAEYLPDQPVAAHPVAATADFTGNGIVDFAVFDAGNMELGQHSRGGFHGEAPLMLVGQPDGTWRESGGLVAAVEEADPRYCWPECSGVIHVKHVAVGDLNGNGSPDMFVESGGGYNNPAPHFMINQGDGRFELDASVTRLSDLMMRGATGQFRYASQIVVDMNADGLADLAMGQLRRIDNGQDNLTSLIAWNDGTDEFSELNATPLPYARFNEGYTYVKAMAPLDINNDGLLDLVLSHERGNLIPDPDGVGNTGRYLQILIQTPEGFADETAERIGTQDRTVAARAAPYGANLNAPRQLNIADIDGDGTLDLFMAGAGPVGRHAPLLYLNDGDGRFIAYPAQQFTSEEWFGENAILADVDGNGVLDIVHSDDTPGPDGQYGTADDATQLVTTIVSRR